MFEDNSLKLQWNYEGPVFLCENTHQSVSYSALEENVWDYAKSTTRKENQNPD
jgi:hypothetical protein